jgi:superfamily I DNA/RNA helicase
METKEDPSSNDLRDMSPEELVQAYKAAHLKAIRIEIGRRLDLHQGFQGFLESADLFLAADPGDPPVSTFRKEFSWHDAFKRNMGNSNKEGLRKRLSVAQWGLLLKRHFWYFGISIESVQSIVPPEVLEQICNENPECLVRYSNAGTLIASLAMNPSDYRVRKHRQAFIDSAVVLDIEISPSADVGCLGFKEVCYKIGDQTEIWEASELGDLSDFLNNLAETAKGRWLVGHNLLGWDLPRLRDFMGAEFLSNSPVWDTLVIQTLLEPWLVSQALTGAEKAHQADADVDATLMLFRAQAEALGMDFEALRNDSLSPVAFVELACSTLRERPSSRRPPPPPDFVSKCPEDCQGVLLPESAISMSHWVPGLRFESALRDPPRFGKDPSESGFSVMCKIAETVILDLLAYAESQHIDLIPSMIPRWIAAAAPELLADQQLFAPPSTKDAPQNDWVAVCAYEKLTKEQIESLDSSSWHEPFAGLRRACIVKQLGSSGTPPSLAKRPDLSTSSRQIRRIGAADKPAIAPASSDDAELWADYHPARWREPRPWHVWDATLCRLDTQQVSLDKLCLIRFRIPVCSRGGSPQQTVSAASEDRHQYWSDMIAIVDAILKHEEAAPVVHILLLDQAAELGMADKLFAELRWAPGFGRSRFQRLNSLKGEESGKCLVGLLRDAIFWKRVAERCNVRIEFILPELPIDQWAIAMPPPETPTATTINTIEAEETDAQDDEDDSSSMEMRASDDEQEGEEREINLTNKRDRGPSPETYAQTVESNLLPWLQMLFDGCRPWVLDTRVARACKPGCFEPANLDLVDSVEVEATLDEFRHELGSPVRREADHSVENYRKLLKSTWGFDDFKPDTQLPAIREITGTDRDVLVALPTGEGKSVLFQIPALIEGMASGRLSIVISPLKALMKDQVFALQERGFELGVDYLSSDLNRWALDESCQRIIDGQTKLLYVAPERFRNPRFQDLLRRRSKRDGGFGYAILDEAHCFWLWGTEFRPDYFYSIAHLNETYRHSGPGLRYLLFSATVTESVLENLRKHVGDRAEQLSVCPDDRLPPVRDFLELEPDEIRPLGGEDWDARLRSRVNRIAEKLKGEPLDPSKSIAVIFVPMRRQAEICRDLIESDLPEWNPAAFHAGLSAPARQQTYEDLKNGKVHLLAATKAFGMGMDIPNIHRCFHLSPPCFLEDYLQEVGRTGRGEVERSEANLEQVRCTVLWDLKDLDRNKDLVKRNALNIGQLGQIHNFACETAYESESGEKLALLFPRREIENPSDTLLRCALGWLERNPLERIEIVQSLPHLLEIRVKDPNRFQEQAGQPANERVRRTQEVIANVLKHGKVVTSSVASSSGYRFLGEALAPKENDESGWRRMILSLTALFREARLESLNEAYGILGEFIRSGLIKVERNIEYEHGRNWDSRKMLLDAGSQLMERITKETAESIQPLIHEELRECAAGILEKQAGEISKEFHYETTEIEAMSRALVRATLRSARAAGIEVRETINDDGQVCQTFRLPSATRTATTKAWREVWKQAAELAAHCFADLDQKALAWDELLKQAPHNGGFETLRGALGILSSLRVIHLRQSFGATNYLVRIKSDSPIIGTNNEPTNGAAEEVAGDLIECNEFNRLRELAMELWLQIPEIQDRRAFVDNYFKAADSDTLLEILEQWVGKLEEVDGEFSQMLEHLRQRSLDQELDRLKTGGELTQHTVATIPAGRDVLVNAGPGAGKTRVLLARAAHMIHEQDLKPEQILILAFNRAVVSELRRRINSLFGQMGYGSYVRRLRIHTFHGFAARHNATTSEGFGALANKDDLKKMLGDFSRKVCSNPSFAERVSAGTKVLLVDEFQDMNDDLFDMLLSMKAASGLAITVIGDDDQDILRWTREGSDAVSATSYFKRFVDKIPNVEQHPLRANFRSCKTIVERSQILLSNLIASGGEDERLKQDINLFAIRKEEGQVESFSDWAGGISSAIDEAKKGGSCAILCGTNAEAAKAYAQITDQLIDSKIPIRLLGGETGEIRLGRLRHVAEMIDLIGMDLGAINCALASNDSWKEISSRFNTLDLPEQHNDGSLSLSSLRQAYLAQEPRATFGEWRGWLGELRIDEAERILADVIGHKTHQGVTVATIHKVKGLEFDSVVIMPSESRYDEGIKNKHDEARLYYVGFTRAKDKAYLGWGARERAWAKNTSYSSKQKDANQSPVLVSDFKEVVVSFAASEARGEHLQFILRHKVKTGQEVILNRPTRTGSYSVITTDHGEIGRISKLTSIELQERKLGQFDNTSFRVAYVLRYQCDEKDREPNKEYPKADFIVKRGWFYTVLLIGVGNSAPD